MVVWDKLTGAPLHNAIGTALALVCNTCADTILVVWSDARTAATVNRLIHETPTNDKTYYLVLLPLLPFTRMLTVSLPLPTILEILSSL